MSTQTTFSKENVNEPTTTKSKKRKAEKGSAVSKAFVQRLKDRLAKANGKVKQATEEAETQRRQNYELEQYKNRLLVG